MQHHRETIGTIGGALARAQIELAKKAIRSFGYACSSSGLEILTRKSLGGHKIETVQTTSIDEAEPACAATFR